ncbi:MAG: DUF2281 domain-containing protein [Ignavibacteria bacterium]|nr:DUF2281 domain-containing protein [Ignavibacteria bacterium]
MNTQLNILQLLQQLPEEKQVEVLHYVEFLLQKYSPTKHNVVKEETQEYGVQETTTINREELKQEIDQLPEQILEEVYRLLHPMQKEKKRRVPFKTYNLGGQLDKVNIRKFAYEE